MNLKWEKFVTNYVNFQKNRTGIQGLGLRKKGNEFRFTLIPQIILEFCLLKNDKPLLINNLATTCISR